MELGPEIEKITNSLLANPAHFLVDIAISGNKVQKKIVIVLDGDEGVNIEDCAKLSRAVSKQLDEKALINENYTLEVTTPGVDTPLRLLRQYKKNVGRTLKVTLKDRSQLKGKLAAANESQIELNAEMKESKKKTENKMVTIPFETIDKALVQISFK